MANDPNWEPDGVTHQVRFCEGGGTYRQGFPPLLSTFSQGTEKNLTPRSSAAKKIIWGIADQLIAGAPPIARHRIFSKIGRDLGQIGQNPRAFLRFSAHFRAFRPHQDATCPSSANRRRLAIMRLAKANSVCSCAVFFSSPL